MGTYQVVYDPRVLRPLRNAPLTERQRFLSSLSVLQTTPRGLGKKIKKLTNVKHGYRLRVGDWRVLYLITESGRIVTVFQIDRRDKAYK